MFKNHTNISKRLNLIAAISLIWTVVLQFDSFGQITQDFESWPTFYSGNYSGQGWDSYNNWCYDDGFGNQVLMFGIGLNSELVSPLLTNGVDRIEISSKNAGVSVTLDIEFSTNGVSGWTLVDSLTHADTSYVTNILDTKVIRDGYLRFVYSGAQLEEADYITIHENPILFSFTNLTLSPATPLVDTPTDVSIELVPSSAQISNIAVELIYSTDDMLTFQTNLTTPSGLVFDTTIPSQTEIGRVVQYYYKITFDFNGLIDQTEFYPTGTVNEPLHYTCDVVYGAMRSQDFQSYPDSYAYNDQGGWIVGQNFTWVYEAFPPNKVAHMLVDPGNEVFVRTPLLTNGAGTLYFDALQSATGDIILHIESSTNGSSWTFTEAVTVAATNVSEINIWNTKMIRLNHYTDEYLRILLYDGGVPLSVYIDNIFVSYPPADAIITNITRQLGYMYITNEVSVTCDISPASASIPAGNFIPKLCFRSDSSLPFTTSLMTRVSGNTYQQYIPPTGEKGIVEYFIRCDFSGYYYTNSLNNEKITPAFSPDAPETQETPDSFYSYNVRPFRSSHNYLTVTSQVGTTTMKLIGDYEWQGSVNIDAIMNPQTSLTFRVLGYSEYVPGNTNYNSSTNYWGDNSVGFIDVPNSGTATLDDNPIKANGPFNSPVVISFNTMSRDYVIVRGFFQDFNSWNADSDFFSKSVFGIANNVVTGRWEDFPISSIAYSTPTNDSSPNFDEWGSPTDFLPLDEVPVKAYMVEDVRLLDLRGDGSSSNKALEFKSVANEGFIYPTFDRLLPPGGIGHVEWRYRCTEHEDYAAVLNNNGKDWQDIAVEVGVTWNSVTDESALILRSRYSGDTSPRDYCESRTQNLLGNKEKNYMVTFYTMTDNNITNQWNSFSGKNGSLNARTDFGFRTFTDNAGRITHQTRYVNNTWQGKRQLSETAFTVNSNSVAIAPLNCDINIDWVKVSPLKANYFESGETNAASITETELWYWELCKGRPPKMTNQNSFLVSPYLWFEPQQIMMSIDQNGSGVPGPDINVYGSTGRGVSGGEPTDGSFLITNIVINDTSPINLTINIPTNNYNYIWLCENLSSPTSLQINNIRITGDDYYTDFSSPSETNRWFLDTRGGWSYTTNNGGSLHHPGYYGPELGISLSVSTNIDYLNNNTFESDWTTIYTNTYSNLQFASDSFTLDDLTNYVHHADWMYFRLKHTRGNASLVLDDINFSSWRGYNYTNSDNWIMTHGWVEAEGSNRYVSLPRDRAPDPGPSMATGRIQYVQSPVISNGISSISFNYIASNTPIQLGVFTCPSAFINDDESFVLRDSIIIETPVTDWSNKSLTFEVVGDSVVRIINTSTTIKANILIDDLKVTDYRGKIPSTWVGNNVLITPNQDSREFEPAEDSFRTCYFNSDDSSNVRQTPDPKEAYVESPYSENGIGRVSFYYRHWETNGSPPGRIDFYVATNRWKETTSSNLWEHVYSLTDITNTQYQYFSKSFYIEDQNYLRIINGTNAYNGRICLDNILILEPMGATLVMTNLNTVPAVPLFSTDTSISVEIAEERFFPSNLTLTAYYKYGTGDWGIWNNGDADGSFVMTNVGGTGSVYTSVGQIPKQNIDDIVQYYIEADFEGQFANSPLKYTGFDVPDWYFPENMNTNYAANSPYYWTFSCTTGAVWINEYNVFSGFLTKTNQFIELCGQQAVDIEDWKIEILDDLSNVVVDSYVIKNNPTPHQNPTNAIAFWVLGDGSIANADQAITNALNDNLYIRLSRSMGAYVQPVVRDYSPKDSPTRTFDSVALKGTGSWATDFSWDASIGNWSPGSINSGQILINAFGDNPFVSIEILDYWHDNDQTWVVYKLSGTNFHLPPVPLYTTNIVDTGSWNNVYSITPASYTNSVNVYTSWWNTLNYDKTFHKLSVTNIY
ncbi:hypothetical protein BVX97_00130 [bacterium E08(2017)]|nr:hypothetical protein BVX97_00130 [bacterium E08(2017)]